MRLKASVGWHKGACTTSYETVLQAGTFTHSHNMEHLVMNPGCFIVYSAYNKCYFNKSLTLSLTMMSCDYVHGNQGSLSLTIIILNIFSIYFLVCSFIHNLLSENSATNSETWHFTISLKTMSSTEHVFKNIILMNPFKNESSHCFRLLFVVFPVSIVITERGWTYRYCWA